MKGIIVAGNGLGNIVNEDISELLDIEPGKNEIVQDIAIIDIDVYADLCRLTYRCQSCQRVLLLIDDIHTDDLDALDQIRLASPDKKLFSNAKTFRVHSKNFTSTVLDPADVEKAIGGKIFDILNSFSIKLDVDLKNPDIAFYAYVFENMKKSAKNRYRIIIGLDFSGELDKRTYRIFNSSMALKGTTAYALLRLSGFKASDTLLDPYCNSGTLAIEAALNGSNMSPRFFDKRFPFMKLGIYDDKAIDKFFKDNDASIKAKGLHITAADPLLRNITAAKKNAKIAGVEKLIEFRRIDIDWVDVKFEKLSVDKIITFIPGSSKFKDDKLLEKHFKEFFYQAEFILKDSGSLVVMCISKDILMNASKEYFKLKDTKQMMAGQQVMDVLFFIK